MKKKKPTFWEFLKKFTGFPFLTIITFCLKTRKTRLNLNTKFVTAPPIDWSDGL